MPSPVSPAPISTGNRSATVIAWIAAAALLLNALFAVWLWRLHRRQESRINRLEAAITGARTLPPPGGPPATGTKASREDRLALLEASAGNVDNSKRLLADVSVAEAVEMARTLLARPAASERNSALEAVCQKIAAEDPARAVAMLGEVLEPTLRNTLAVRVTNLWIEQSPDAAERWLGAAGESVLSRDAFDAQLARAASRWSAFDPGAATAFLTARKILGELSLTALANASSEWGRQDAARALAWAQDLPPGDPRRLQLVQNILAGWAEREPARAAAYLQERLYDGGEGSELYYSSVGLVAERWARFDLNAAAQWAVTLPAGRVRRDALRRVAVAWAAADLPSAARWAGSLPANSGRGEAWQVILSSWPGSDFDGEGAWVSSLPAGPERDETVALHAAKIAPTDPAKALQWARIISGPSARTRSVDAILTSWTRVDPAAARNWAAANGMTPAGL